LSHALKECEGFHTFNAKLALEKNCFRLFGRLALTDRSVCQGDIDGQFHLRENTVDIDGRFDSTYGELRLILTVDIDRRFDQ